MLGREPLTKMPTIIYTVENEVLNKEKDTISTLIVETVLITKFNVFRVITKADSTFGKLKLLNGNSSFLTDIQSDYHKSWHFWLRML